jgi:hypothetical protein
MCLLHEYNKKYLRYADYNPSATSLGESFYARYLSLSAVGIKTKNSRGGEVIYTHVFDYVPGQLSRKKSTFKESSFHARVIQNGLLLTKWMTFKSCPC